MRDLPDPGSFGVFIACDRRNGAGLTGLVQGIEAASEYGVWVEQLQVANLDATNPHVVEIIVGDAGVPAIAPVLGEILRAAHLLNKKPGRTPGAAGQFLSAAVTKVKAGEWGGPPIGLSINPASRLMSMTLGAGQSSPILPLRLSLERPGDRLLVLSELDPVPAALGQVIVTVWGIELYSAAARDAMQDIRRAYFGE